MSFWHNRNHRIGIPLWTAGFGLGVLFLIVGGLGGQLADVYRKAVMICLECIGIG